MNNFDIFARNGAESIGDNIGEAFSSAKTSLVNFYGRTADYLNRLGTYIQDDPYYGIAAIVVMNIAMVYLVNKATQYAMTKLVGKKILVISIGCGMIVGSNLFVHAYVSMVLPIAAKVVLAMASITFYLYKQKVHLRPQLQPVPQTILVHHPLPNPPPELQRQLTPPQTSQPLTIDTTEQNQEVETLQIPFFSFAANRPISIIPPQYCPTPAPLYPELDTSPTPDASPFLFEPSSHKDIGRSATVPLEKSDPWLAAVTRERRLRQEAENRPDIEDTRNELSESRFINGDVDDDISGDGKGSIPIENDMDPYEEEGDWDIPTEISDENDLLLNTSNLRTPSSKKRLVKKESND